MIKTMFGNIELDPRFKEAVDNGALVVLNHSGGKDSMAMYEVIKPLVPPENFVVVHADLGDEVEWKGVKELIKANIEDTPLYYAKAKYGKKNGNGPKTMLNYVEYRKKWPDSARRFCTSDLKRGPIEVVIRRLMEEGGYDTVISCIGYRWDESPSRAKKEAWELPKKHNNLKKKKRTWVNFSPILPLTTEDVFKIIEDAGKEPHWAYKKGMKRLSCVFCPLAGDSHLKAAAKIAPPGLLKKYTDLEKKIGHTFKNGKTLLEITSEEENELPLLKLAA